MSAENPIAALLCVVLACLTAAVFLRVKPAMVMQGRFGTIDGLRGYLAFFVFLHHVTIWYGYAHTGRWLRPDSNLFHLLGHGSVAVFFMITAFLFFNKVLDSRMRPIDWTRLYVSRVMRLAPLYLVAMLVLFLVVAASSGFVVREPPLHTLNVAVRWLTFTVLGSPDLNGVTDTRHILAGVTWSLPYEWFFYFSLPVLALIARVKVPLVIAAQGIVVAMLWMLWDPEAYEVLAFVPGLIAAVLCRNAGFLSVSRTPIASIAVIALVVCVIINYPSTHNGGAVVLFGAAFCLIAGGCSIFGLLEKSVSRFLGDMSYSLYLLHGVLLFVTFRFVLGTELAASLSAMQHWAVALGLTPILIGLGYTTFRLIERPGMEATPRVLNAFRPKSDH